LFDLPAELLSFRKFDNNGEISLTGFSALPYRKVDEIKPNLQPAHNT